MRKRVCIITGANSGIGKAAAAQIMDEGVHVIMACRNKERGSSALQELLTVHTERSGELMLVDMGEQNSIRTFAEKVKDSYPIIDVIIHNAASFDISQKSPIKTSDGIESIWATDHIGPVLLTELLLQNIKASDDGRIITVASKGLIIKPRLKIDLEDPEFKNRRFSVSNAYYQAKRAQIIYTYYLSEQLKGTHVTTHCIRVTNVKIDISRYPDVSGFMRWLYSMKSKKSITPEAMAKVYTHAAISPEMKGCTGSYIDEQKREVRSVPYTYDTDVQKQVMQLTSTYAPELKKLIG
mgnify:CR=1 FL=1